MTGVSLSRTLPLSALQPPSASSSGTNATIAGVRFGLESYSLSTLPHEGVVDAQIALMVEMGLTECGLWETLITPAPIVEMMTKARAMGEAGAPPSAEKLAATAAANDALKQWRMSVSLDTFTNLRRKFDAAGINLYGYSPAVPKATTSDEELKRSCEMAHALGVKLIISSMPRSVAKRFVPLAEHYDLKVGIQGVPKTSSIDPDAVATPANYLEAVSYSRNYGIWMDVGDATAAGFDALNFLKENQAHFYGINLKDRKKDATSMPWGEGDAHIKELLLFLRDTKSPIHAYIDCDYKTAPDSTRVADIKRCLAYAKTTLTT
jgi:sugar phosphate isomerase/epimerase